MIKHYDLVISPGVMRCAKNPVIKQGEALGGAASPDWGESHGHRRRAGPWT